MAVDIHGKRKDTDNTHPIPLLILLNDGFKFEKRIILDEENNPLEKECLKSLESLCVFGYREYYKNLLCILVEFYSRITAMATPVPKSMMEIFDLFSSALINHMIWGGKFKNQVLPHSYKLGMNKPKLIVSHANTHPVQFDLRTIPSAATFIEKQRSGWNKANIAEYFSVTEENEGTQRHNQRPQKMTTSLQYEVHYILLWCMREIRVTKVKNSKQFQV